MSRASQMSRAKSASFFGLADALLIWAMQIVATFVTAGIVVAAFFDGELPDPQPIALLLAVQIGGWLVYVLGPTAVTTRRGRGPRAELRLAATPADLAGGFVGGALLQLIAVPLIYWPIQRVVDDDPGDTARDLVSSVDGPLEILGLTLLVAVGAPLVEEFFYRGFVLRAAENTLERRTNIGVDTRQALAVLFSSIVFALVHIEPLLYPGTFMLGLVAGATVVKTGRLGLAWGLHFGFNAVTLVVLLLERS